MILTRFLKFFGILTNCFLQITLTGKPYSADGIKALTHSRMFHKPGACCFLYKQERICTDIGLHFQPVTAKTVFSLRRIFLLLRP